MLTYVLDSLADPEAFLEKVNALYQTTTIDHDMVLFKDGRIIERYSYPIMSEADYQGASVVIPRRHRSEQSGNSAEE